MITPHLPARPSTRLTLESLKKTCSNTEDADERAPVNERIAHIFDNGVSDGQQDAPKTKTKEEKIEDNDFHHFFPKF